MFPRGNETPVDLSRFGALSGVIDAVYNPLRTPLVLAARERGIRAEGGLYNMLRVIETFEIFTCAICTMLIYILYAKLLDFFENLSIISL